LVLGEFKLNEIISRTIFAQIHIVQHLHNCAGIINLVI
jgi:hypothetical protein